VSSGEFITGVKGNGCTVSIYKGSKDPLFILLILLSVLILLGRKGRATTVRSRLSGEVK